MKSNFSHAFIIGRCSRVAIAALALTLITQSALFATVTQPTNGQEVGDNCFAYEPSGAAEEVCLRSACGVLYGSGTNQYNACKDNARQELRKRRRARHQQEAPAPLPYE